MNYKKSKFLVVLIAPSGGGKSTICKKILEQRNDVEYSISYTTRKPRGNEENGKDYFFVDEETFIKKINNGDFIEFAKVHNHWYGTSSEVIEEIIKNGKLAILDIDIQGAVKVKDKNIDMVSIFLIPPSNNILTERLKSRKTETDKQIALRLENAKNEINKCKDFDYLVINEELDKAINEVNQIIDSEQNKSFRYIDVLKIYYGHN
jgi:guanylate kinase